MGSEMCIRDSIYIGYLFNLFLLGSTGGDVVRSYYIAKETNKKTEMVTLVFFDRIIGMFSMMCIALSALMFNLYDPRLKAMAFIVSAMLILIVIFFLCIYFKDNLKKHHVLQYILKKLAFKNTLKRISDTMHFFKDCKLRILAGVLLSLSIQILAILVCYIVGISLSGVEKVPLRYFFLMMPIIFMGSALPVSLGGWGVFESGFVFCFALVGVDKGDALSIGLMNRLVLIILGIIGAILYIMPGTSHLAAQAIEEEMEGYSKEV